MEQYGRSHCQIRNVGATLSQTNRTDTRGGEKPVNFTSNINNKQDLGFIIPVHIPRMTWKGRRKRAAILGMGGGRKEKKKIHAFT